MTRREFFELVLSTRGYISIRGLNADGSGYPRKENFTDFDEVDTYIDGLLREKREVYFSCATFNDTHKPSSVANIAKLKSFFIDIDCGVSKPYKNKKEGLLALQKFCQSTRLPLPTLVDSGNGVHGYWILEDGIDYNLWKPLGEGLKRRIQELGFHVDHSVTGDGARILRVPDTLNTKNRAEPKEVKVVRNGTVLTYKDFAALIPPVLDHSAFSRLPADELTKNLMGGEYPTSLFETILKKSHRTQSVKEKIKVITKDSHGNEDYEFKTKIVERNAGCPQLLFCYENRAVLEEPLWFAALSVARRCTDWEDAIEKVSLDYPGYTFENAVEKADHTKGPRRCDEFQKLHPEGCMNCIHKGKITSPIQLGAYTELAKPEDNILEDQWHEGLNTITTIEVPTEYPWPWVRPKKGGVARIELADPNESPEEAIQAGPQTAEIYDNDLWVVKRLDDPKDGIKVHCVLVRPKEGVIEFTAPLTTIAKKEKCQDLLAFYGVTVIGRKVEMLQQYLMAWVTKLEKESKAEKARLQFGWHDDNRCFVIGSREIRGAGQIVYSPPSSATANVAPLYETKGDIAAWKEVANLYNNPGNEARAFVLFSGFAAALYNFFGEGSMQIHLTNAASGVGKTTAQRMAASIWGNPRETLLTHNDTRLARQHRFGVIRHLPALIDEITNMTPEELSHFVFELNQNRGRNRMQSQSNSERENDSTWSTIAITSGNNSVYDTIKQHRSSVEGEMYRVLEIAIDTDKHLSKDQSDFYYNDVLRENYGLAGDIFIGYVIDNLPAVLQRLKGVKSEFDTLAGFKQKERFYSACCAAVFTAAEITKKLELHDIDVDRIKAWAVRTLGVVQAAVKEASSEDSVAVLGRFLNEHQRNILVIHRNDDPTFNSVPVREAVGDLVARYETDKEEPQLYIAKSALEKWCSANRIPVAGFYKSLEVTGMINGLNHRKRLSEGTHVSGLPVPTIWVDAKKLDTSYLGY